MERSADAVRRGRRRGAVAAGSQIGGVDGAALARSLVISLPLGVDGPRQGRRSARPAVGSAGVDGAALAAAPVPARRPRPRSAPRPRRPRAPRGGLDARGLETKPRPRQVPVAEAHEVVKAAAAAEPTFSPTEPPFSPTKLASDALGSAADTLEAAYESISAMWSGGGGADAPAAASPQ